MVLLCVVGGWVFSTGPVWGATVHTYASTFGAGDVCRRRVWRWMRRRKMFMSRMLVLRVWRSSRLRACLYVRGVGVSRTACRNSSRARLRAMRVLLGSNVGQLETPEFIPVDDSGWWLW